MSIDQTVAIISLCLSVFFWWNARQQTAESERILQEIKSQIISWQNELNKTAIEMLSARPDMIAKQTMLAESNSEAQFTSSMANLIEQLAKSNVPDTKALVDSLLSHHATIVLEKQRIGMNAATRSREV